MIFSEKHEMIRKLAREFAERELTPEVLKKVEETNCFPKEILNKMAECGFFGITSPTKIGGQGSGYLSYVIVMEEICRLSGVAGVYVSSPNSLSTLPIIMAGTPEQIEKYVTPTINGKLTVAFALTEPGAGSDAGSMTTIAELVDDHYVLNGTKCFITSAPFADYAIVFAKTNPDAGVKGISAFIVDLNLPGVTRTREEQKMGLIGCPTGDIAMQNVCVPKENRLGAEGTGFINAMATLDSGRIGVAAQAIGVAQGCLDETIKFSKSRIQFGKPISKFQYVSFTIAEMATKLQAAKELTYYAADLKDKGMDASMAAAMAKYYAAEVCNEIAEKAVQIHGGYGFVKDYPIERMYRDCRIFTIYEGTSQVQQMVISGKLLK